jgi:hypothetical protein
MPDEGTGLRAGGSDSGRAEVVTGWVSVTLCGYAWGRFERDRVAELFELGHETTCSSFGVLAVGEVVVAEILEDLAGAEQVPDEFDQRMRDGDGGLVRAAAAGDLAVLGAEVAAPGSGPRRGPLQSGRDGAIGCRAWC